MTTHWFRTTALAALALAPGVVLPGVVQAAEQPSPPAPAAQPAKAPPAPATVEAITVTGEAAPITSSIDRRSYSLGKDIAATSGSVADALRNVPTVEVNVDGAVALRGDSNVTILVDGKPTAAFDGANRADALSQMPADQIERVEVITNPSAALNPDGSAGVINLITKKSRGAGLTGSAYLTAGSAGAKRGGYSFGYNSGKLSVTGALAANYQRGKSHSREFRSFADDTGVFNDHLVETVGRNLNRSPNARVTVGYALTPKDQLSAAYSYNHLLIYGYPSNHYADLLPGGGVALQDRVGHRRLAQNDTGLTAGWKHSFAGDGHTLSVDLIQNRSRWGDRFEWKPFNVSPPRPVTYDLSTRSASQTHSELRVGYARPLDGGAKLALGYELKYDDNPLSFGTAYRPDAVAADTDPALTSVFLYKQTINAGYATYERAFGDVSLQAGLRVEGSRLELDERNSRQTYDSDDVRAYPTLHLAYALDGGGKLSASYSKRIQRPPAVLLDPFPIYGDPRVSHRGNPRLQPQETQSFEAAYEKRKGSTYYLVTAFYRLNDKEFIPLLQDAGDGAILQTFGNLGASRTAGLEFTANGSLTKSLTYTASGSVYWKEINAANLGYAGDRSAHGVNARVNLNWQARANDLLQLNLIANGRRLYPQGVDQPNTVVNLGWRHKIDDRVTATLSVQDAFGTLSYRTDVDSPTLRGFVVTRPVNRTIALRLDYRFGGGSKAPAKAPGFEYENPAPSAP